MDRKPENSQTKHEEIMQYIRILRLMDDRFMTSVFQDTACAETLLKIILEKDDFKISEIHTQHDIPNLQGRSIRLDILATDSTGRLYNIEIQRDSKGAVEKRARYHSALLDANITEPGEKYEALNETYIIFITENDILEEGRPIYHIDRTIRESGRIFRDESHIIYVNSQIQDETALGRLMHDFYCTDPNDMYYKDIATRVRYLKENTEGVMNMQGVFETYGEKCRRDGIAKGRAKGRVEGRAEGKTAQARETAVNLKKLGLSIDNIAMAVGQSVPVVETWLKQNSHVSTLQ